jgi:thiol-disulfide isomerase/thioredoxin
MDRRRFVALGSLGLVGAGVGGLVLTRNDGGDDDVAAPDDGARGAAEPAAAPTSDDGEAAEPAADPLVPELPVRGPHPPLLEIDGWLQSEVSSLEELRGKVVAVQFWTFGCFNCKNTMPHMRALHDEYAGADFEIVGVHAPEFDHERDPDRIAEAAAEQGIVWPIALDTEKTSFRSWQTERRFWPRLYLIDRDGNIRYDKIGEGKYDEIDAAVGALIAESPSGELGDRDPDDNADPM